MDRRANITKQALVGFASIQNRENQFVELFVSCKPNALVARKERNLQDLKINSFPKNGSGLSFFGKIESKQFICLPLSKRKVFSFLSFIFISINSYVNKKKTKTSVKTEIEMKIRRIRGTRRRVRVEAK